MAGVVLILGPERFLARQALTQLLQREPGREVTRHDGQAVAVAQVLDDARTPSLLGGARTVVVEEAGKLLEGDSLTALADYAQSPVGDALLVLQGSLDKRLKHAKRLEQAAEVIRCDALQPRAVAGWIAKHARSEYELSVPADAAQALRDRIGDDLGLLDGALARLKEQIAPKKRLAAKDIEESTGEQRSPILFEVANCLETRDLPGALAALDAAYREGIQIKQDVVSDPGAVTPILLGNLHRAYTKLLRFHFLAARGGDEAEAARSAGVSPRAVPYFLQRARRHDLDTLAGRHRRFLEADLAIKTGGSDPRRALERLLIALL